MTRFQELLLNVSLFLSMVTLSKARITVNKCQDSSPKASCRQECYEDCKMSCGQADPQLKSCEQTCLDHGQCDLKCVTKETCHQDCEALLTCGSVFCETANCTQRCDERICKMSCRATSRCKQLCNAGSSESFWNSEMANSPSQEISGSGMSHTCPEYTHTDSSKHPQQSCHW